jgi:hypothetical protein
MHYANALRSKALSKSHRETIYVASYESTRGQDAAAKNAKTNTDVGENLYQPQSFTV